MLSIGEFSNICNVSTKTLRYYAEIGLILPYEINAENGYRYYSMEQLKTMLFINRLKSYNFSLEEIKVILESEESQDEKLYKALAGKRQEIGRQVQDFERTLDQLNSDLSNLRQGKSIMSYLDNIEVQLVEVPVMYLMSIRKMVQKFEFEGEYKSCFGKLLRVITEEKRSMTAPPMVLFHSAEFSPFGLDTEFAIPVKEDRVKEPYVPVHSHDDLSCRSKSPDFGRLGDTMVTRDFTPGLCIKTVLHGSYSNLTSVYAKQRQWAEEQDYESSNALYEVYVTDPSQVSNDSELITEVYYPVKKRL